MRTTRILSGAGVIATSVSASLAIAGMVLAPVAAARAQDAALALPPTAAPTPFSPGPALAAPATASASATADPPSRVGRLARIAGTVSFHTADEDHWEPATLNYPVTSGNAFWTEPNASARIDVSASEISMAASTEFDIDQLDAAALSATEAQGETFLQLPRLQPGETLTIRTPRGTVTLAASGIYDIAAGDTQTPTTVSVIEGAAQITGDNLTLQVQANQTASITGTGAAGDPLQGNVGALAQDAFLAAMLQPPPRAEAPVLVQRAPQAPAAAPPPVVADMSGSEDLPDNGTWQATPQYGAVWYPRVAQDWVPYRDGHWAYVAPWGWTWVDNASWGFAPFHYGRWVQNDDRWGWTPGYSGGDYGNSGYAEPVYAPALVSFCDPGAGFVAGLAVGAVVGAAIGASVGWFPLGYNEPYRPWYQGSDNYVRNVNRISVSNVTNITNVNNSTTVINNRTVNNYANQNAATVTPTAAMVSGQQISRAALPVTATQAAAFRPSQPGVTPTAATPGLTPRVARQIGIPAASLRRTAATGPAFVVAAAPAAHPALRPALSAGVAGAAVGGVAGGVANTARLAPNAARPGVPAAPGAVPASRSALSTGVAAGALGGAAGVVAGRLANAARPAPNAALNAARPGAPAAPGAVPAARAGLPALRPVGAAANRPTVVGAAPGPSIAPHAPRAGIGAAVVPGRAGAVAPALSPLLRNPASGRPPVPLGTPPVGTANAAPRANGVVRPVGPRAPQLAVPTPQAHPPALAPGLPNAASRGMPAAPQNAAPRFVAPRPLVPAPLQPRVAAPPQPRISAPPPQPRAAAAPPQRFVAPQPQHFAAPPQRQPAPPQQHFAPPPQQRFAPPPQQQVAPPQQRFAPPPQRFAPAPQQHFAPPPPPQQHFAPPPQQHFAPPPQQHFAPPPPPRPAARGICNGRPCP